MQRRIAQREEAAKRRMVCASFFVLVSTYMPWLKQTAYQPGGRFWGVERLFQELSGEQ
jgi:hypothetical protein